MFDLVELIHAGDMSLYTVQRCTVNGTHADNSQFTWVIYRFGEFEVSSATVPRCARWQCVVMLDAGCSYATRALNKVFMTRHDLMLAHEQCFNIKDAISLATGTSSARGWGDEMSSPKSTPCSVRGSQLHLYVILDLMLHLWLAFSPLGHQLLWTSTTL